MNIEKSPFICNELPVFNIFKLDSIENIIIKILETNRTTINKLVLTTMCYTWENLISPIEQLETYLNYHLNIIAHLNDMTNSAEFNEIYRKVVTLILEYRFEMLYNDALFKAFHAIEKNKNDLNNGQKMALKIYLNNFKTAGVHLQEVQKKEVKEIALRLAELGSIFEKNIISSIEAYSLHITDINILTGMPEEILAVIGEEAKNLGKSGWLIRLDPFLYGCIMKYAKNSNFRKQIYFAYSTIASTQSTHGKNFDNNPVIIEILNLRMRVAKILGYNNFAEYSLIDKTLNTPKVVLDFLINLLTAFKYQAKLEFDEIKEFAKQNGIYEVHPWDIAYLSNNLQKQKHGLTIENCEIYFPKSKVLNRLFTLVQELFNVEIVELNEFDTWHEDVELFNAYDSNGKLRGRFYMDLYSRPEKRSGAWCSEFKSRLKNSLITQLPVACVITNIHKKIGEEGIEFSHQDLIALFHEFGHCMQKILTTVDYSVVAGDNGIPLDVTELVSQFMENWCWEEELLFTMIKDIDNSYGIKERLSKFKNIKNFQIGLRMIREIILSLFDIKLHTFSSTMHDNFCIQDVFNKIKKDIDIFPINCADRSVNSFSHIFSAGFAAGYYSYLFSEMLAKDTFSYFEENNLLCKQVGLKFLSTILEQTGIKNITDLFFDFRGRFPIINCSK